MKKTSPTRSTRTARAVPVKTKPKASKAKVKTAKITRVKSHRPGLVGTFTPAQKRRMKDGTATFRDRIALKQAVA